MPNADCDSLFISKLYALWHLNFHTKRSEAKTPAEHILRMYQLAKKPVWYVSHAAIRCSVSVAHNRVACLTKSRILLFSNRISTAPWKWFTLGVLVHDNLFYLCHLWIIFITSALYLPAVLWTVNECGPKKALCGPSPQDHKLYVARGRSWVEHLTLVACL